MKRVTESDLDLALHYAVHYCYEDEIMYMGSYDGDGCTVSRRTERRVKRAWRQNERENSWHIPKGLKTAAIALLVTVSLLFGAAMCIEPVRAAFVQAIITWYEDNIEIAFSREATETEFVPMIPTYIPDGWSVEESILDNDSLSYKMHDSKNNYLSYVQKKNVSTVECSWDYELEETEIKNEEIIFISNDKEKGLIICAVDGFYFYVCYNGICNSDAEKILTSIQKTQKK